MLPVRLNPARRSRRSVSTFRLIPILAFLALGLGAASHAQEPPAPQPDQPASNPDARIVDVPPPAPKTPAQLNDQAWSMLTDAARDQKHAELRIQAIAALGTMGSTPRSLRLLHDATSDKDVDVRTAAILADGQTRSPSVTTDLRQMLDDKEPQVAFAAALTLWKMHDQSGEDVLMAVAGGDRTAAPGMVDSTEHSLKKELHNPAGMARYGAMQGAYMLLGPFGMGLSAYEYMHKNGGDTARVQAIEAIAQNHTQPIRNTLVTALADNDLGVRAASARALALYHEEAVSTAIATLFVDSKPPVRLTAAAAYLVSSGDAQPSPDPNAPPPPPARKSRSAHSRSF